MVLANLQLYVLDASKTRLGYPIDRFRLVPNMEVVRLDTLEDRIGVTVSSREPTNTTSKTWRDFAFW